MSRLACTIFLGSLIASLPLSTFAFTILGTGAAALVGDDLTDRGNDGVEANYNPTNDYGGFDAEFFASANPAFNNGESAFNLFDNQVSGGTAKWCCGPVTNTITARILAGRHLLTAFTVTSSNDTPARDPRVWEIQGSNDGVNFTTIFRQDDPGSAVWGNTRNQVIRFSEADGDVFLVTDLAFSYFRMETFLTGGINYALNEIEFFGVPNLPPIITDLDGDTFAYMPGTGAALIDQGTPAQAADPIQYTNGWSGGSLQVSIVAGGVPAEDRLSIAGGTTIGTATGGTNGTPLLVSFDGSATSNLVTTLLQSISYENLSATPTPSTRLVNFVLSDGDGGTSLVSTVIMEIDIGGAIDSYVWDGGGDGTTFTNELNWVSDAGYPDANDIAIFRTAGAGLIDLEGTRFVGQVIFDGAGNFDLGNGTLVTDDLQQAVTATGSNVVSAVLASATFTGLIEGGIFSPASGLNVNTLATGNWTVHTGATLIKTGGASLGQTAVDLQGGTLKVVPDTATVSGRFIQVINNGATSRSLHIGELEVFAPGISPAVAHAAGAGPLNPTQDLALAPPASVYEKNASSGFISDHEGDDDGRLIDAAETTAGNTFGITGSEAYVIVDLGSTQDIGSIRVHQRNDTCCQDRLMNFSVHVLTDNGGTPGNIQASASFGAQPPDNGFAEVIPIIGGTYTNAITIANESTIELVPGGASTFGDLDFPAAASLDVRAPSGGSLAFIGDTLLGGHATMTQTGMPSVVLNNVSGPGGITLDGDGVLDLATANSYEGETVISNGLVIARDATSLGGVAQGTVVEAGSSLQIFGGVFVEPLSLSGTGTQVDGALNKQPSTTDAFWTGPISVVSTTRVYAAGNRLFLDGGIDLVTNASLEFDAQNQIQIRVNPVVGDASTLLRFEGNDRTFITVPNPDFLGDIEVFNDGRLDTTVSGALGDNAGVTRIISDQASLFVRNGNTHVEDIEIIGDGRGVEGAIRNENNNNTIMGEITMTGDAQIHTNPNSSLTIDGPITGGFALGKPSTGTLILMENNDLSNFDLPGGTVRIAARNGLGDTAVLAVDTGETLGFEGNLTMDASSNLTQINANGGTVSAFNGTSTLDLPVIPIDTMPYRFGGNGHLILTTSIGQGPLSTNELIKVESGRTTLHPANSYNGGTTVQDGTLVGTGPDTLGLGTNLLVEAGSFELNGGFTLNLNQVALIGIGAADQPGALVSANGDNTLNASLTTALPKSLGAVRIAAKDGLFTIHGPMDLRFSTLSTDGAGDIEITGDITGFGVDFIANARFIQVIKNAPGLLHIGEVEAYAPGTSAVNGNSGGALNNPDDLALSSKGAIIIEESANFHGASSGVIDGLEQTGGTTWTANNDGGGNARITIDLGASFDIDSVRVHQRNDGCCHERLEDFTVNLFADDGGVPGALVTSEVFPGRPGLNSFGELEFSKFTDNHLTKLGSGALILSGANTYNGGSTVLGGTLIASSSSPTGPATVTVAGGEIIGGTVEGDLKLDIRGQIHPGLGTGVFTLSSDLVFSNYSSVYIAEIDNATPAGVDRIDVAGNITLNNATLDLQRDAGYLPVVNDTLVIATYGGSLTGTFNGLPNGSSVSAGGKAFQIDYVTGNEIRLIALGTDRVYAGPDTITRSPTEGVSVAAVELLANDLIGTGLGLQIQSVDTTGSNGGTISFANDELTYTPPPGYEGNDSFTYTATDGDDAAIGLVTVRSVSEPEGEAPIGNVGGLEHLPNGDYRVAFTGTPGASYEIQWTEDITTPPVTWNILGSVVADPSGNIVLDHADPPEDTVYYRSALE